MSGHRSVVTIVGTCIIIFEIGSVFGNYTDQIRIALKLPVKTTIYDTIQLSAFDGFRTLQYAFYAVLYPMNTLNIGWLFALIFFSRFAAGQADSVRTPPALRRALAEYDQEIMYFGKRNDYFTVRTFRKNGQLLRIDTYNLLPKTLSNGYQLDSISRIVHHGPTKIMYPTGRVYASCEYKVDVLNGPFMVFYEDGAIKRREYYKFGRITKSECFTPDGEKQTCEPFYQAAKFLGKQKDLAAYIKQKLGPVVDGERIRKVTAALTINEIGQIVDVNVQVATDPSANQQVAGVGIYVQQVMRNMPEWTPEKLNWKPAVNDGVAIASTCVVLVYRISGTLQYNMFYRL